MRTWDSIRRNISQLRADCRLQERGLLGVVAPVIVAMSDRVLEDHKKEVHV